MTVYKNVFAAGVRMMLKCLFEDKRCTAVVLCVWMVAILVIFAVMGVFRSDFFNVGPSKTLHFMSVNVDTWAEWWLLATFCFIDSMVKTFGHDSIVIWSIHTLCDPKCVELPYPKWVCLAVVEMYYVYIYVSGVFKFFISLSQIDFVLINHLSDLIMKAFTYTSYISQKKFAKPADTEFEQFKLIDEK